jgi:hypothetical protein
VAQTFQSAANGEEFTRAMHDHEKARRQELRPLQSRGYFGTSLQYNCFKMQISKWGKEQYAAAANRVRRAKTQASYE